MLRPWVPLIALGLLLALAWQFQPDLLVWAGGILLALALARALIQRLAKGWRKASAERRAAKLDWRIIDQSMAEDRLRQDCERPETLGICTGRECLVYASCQFNIKKPLP